MPVAEPTARPDWGRWFAAVAAIGLGCLAGVMMVAGHQPWDGPEVMELTETHGIHQGDVFAVIPLIVGTVLAWWCFSRSRR